MVKKTCLLLTCADWSVLDGHRQRHIADDFAHYGRCRRTHIDLEDRLLVPVGDVQLASAGIRCQSERRLHSDARQANYSETIFVH